MECVGIRQLLGCDRPAHLLDVSRILSCREPSLPVDCMHPSTESQTVCHEQVHAPSSARVAKMGHRRCGLSVL